MNNRERLHASSEKIAALFRQMVQKKCEIWDISREIENEVGDLDDVDDRLAYFAEVLDVPSDASGISTEDIIAELDKMLEEPDGDAKGGKT